MNDAKQSYRFLFLIGILILVALILAATSNARVLSYSPVTDRTSQATLHHRGARHFALVEITRGASEVVLHDSNDDQPPRVVFSGGTDKVWWVALWEDAGDVPSILIARGPALQPYPSSVIFSGDGGVTWKTTVLPKSTSIDVNNDYADNGGPFTRGRNLPVRIGTREFPFVVYDTAGFIWRVDASGNATQWLPSAHRFKRVPLLGSDKSGATQLVQNDDGTYLLAGFDGRHLVIPGAPVDVATGWIAPDKTVYIESANKVWLYRNLGWEQIYAPSRSSDLVFAIPTFSYDGAWIVERSLRTTIFRHTSKSSLEIIATDARQPNIEAIHTAGDGKTLLLQTHRVLRDAAVTDPEFALWTVGTPYPPSERHQLFATETRTKGFLHLDVDGFAKGEPFVFDAGSDPSSNPSTITTMAAGGGADIIRTGSVLRSSTRQRLVVPRAGSVTGANGAQWSTDVVLYNPETFGQIVEARFVDARGSAAATFFLNGRELITLNVARDVAKRNGIGTFYLTPEKNINAVARTASGAYGYAMPAIEDHATARPRFPVTVPVLPTAAFRSVLSLDDVSASATAPAQAQVTTKTNYAVVRPDRGSVLVSAFAVDNKTNDAMWIPPSLDRGRFPLVTNDTTLYIYNPTGEPRHLRMQITRDGAEPVTTTTLLLAPFETRAFSDVDRTLFAGVRLLAGTAQLAFEGLPVVAHNKTYLVPALNELQVAAAGQSLELLGLFASSSFRTTLGVVGTPAGTARVELFDDKGLLLDTFLTDSTRRFQIDDLFRERHISESNRPILVRITPTSGTVSAYATMTHRTSGDAMYYGPYLAGE